MIGFVRDVGRVLSLPCREHTKLFTRQIDEPLSDGVAAGLRIHILYCTGCSRFRQQIRRLHELAGTIGREMNSEEELPAPVRERVKKRISGITGIN
jgi:hypothetical protein